MKKMTPITIILLLLIGIIAGLLSSLIGIGGGIIIVPALVFLFGFSQKMAQGTSLAMLLPPIGLLGVYIYHKQGNVNWYYAVILIIAFIIGSFFGAKLIQGLNTTMVKKIFAVFMILIAFKYLFFDKTQSIEPSTRNKTSLILKKNQ